MTVHRRARRFGSVSWPHCVAWLIAALLLAGLAYGLRELWYQLGGRRAENAVAGVEVPTTPAPAATENGNRHALLVGCTAYEHLDPRYHLEGPANDVKLLADLLNSKFDFQPAVVHSLIDTGNPDTLPTKANIVREIESLVDQAQPGDEVFILLSGHGSQQLDDDHDPNVDLEPDGYDEIFLPRDIGRWNDTTDSVERAITDDEIRGWLVGLVARGAFVFLVADTCCSGTLARGDEEELRDDYLVRSHLVDPLRLGVPRRPAGDGSIEIVNAQAEEANWLDAARTTGGRGGIVALYAAQAHQKAKEERPKEGAPPHGRLSWAMFEVLQQCERPITYRELSQRILWKYTQRGWIHESTPAVEGTNLDRAVLGAEEWPGRSQFRLVNSASPSGDEYALTAGFLHGVTPDTVFAVYPPPGSADDRQALGHVRVTEALPLTSQVEPIEYAGSAVAAGFPAQARCVPVYHEPGELTLAIAVASEGFSDSDTEAQRTAKVTVTQALQRLTGEPRAMARLVEDAALADWFAIVTPSGLHLQRQGSRYSLDDVNGPRAGEVMGVFELGPDLVDALRDPLGRVARACALVALAEQAATSTNPAIDFELEVSRDSEPLLEGDPVRNNDRLQLVVRNTGLEAISLAVFFVDNAYQVQPFFPRIKEDFLVANNRIGLGKTLYRPIQLRIHDQTIGLEHLLVVAVSSDKELDVNELMELRQAGLVQGQLRSADARPFVSGLARLIEATTSGGTRGQRSAAAAIGGYAIRRISWNVVPTNGPRP